ncbi:MAG TPA: YqgE/AlgH family protein [Burkholderiales bacterium]|nr:YqgE/AlgH family protein [Burkholderiales bacterium]
MLKHLFVAILLVLGTAAAHAQDLGKPLLLVAKPELQGPYNHTAVLVVPMGGQHIGFILNRATEMTLGALFPGHAPSAKVADPVFFGGPERVNAIFAIVARDPGAPSVRLFGDLHVTAQAEVVDRIIEQTPNDARYFAGFVGWRPGELAAELDSGYWYTSEPDAALVFSNDTGTMWEALVKRLGKRPLPAKGMQEA